MDHRKCLLQIEYFPTIWFFAQCVGFSEITLEACEHYQKRSFRNRCQISGPNGTIWLSVPLVKGKNNKKPIQEVTIAYYESWQSVHWHSIQTTYGKTPFFAHYAEMIQDLVFTKSQWLFSKNVQIIEDIVRELELDVHFRMTTEYKKHASENVTDLRNQNPLPGFQKSGKHQFEKYQQPFIYKQSFRSNLSILDLVFCKGPETLNYLEKAFNSLHKKDL